MNLKMFWSIYISLGFFMVGIVVFARISKWDALPLNLDPKNIVGILGLITLAAAFIERAVEVVISPWRDPDASHMVNKLDQAKKHAALTALAANRDHCGRHRCDFGPGAHTGGSGFDRCRAPSDIGCVFGSFHHYQLPWCD